MLWRGMVALLCLPVGCGVDDAEGLGCPLGELRVDGLCRPQTPLPAPLTIEVRAVIVDFGTVQVGESREAEVEIYNPTSEDGEVTIQAVPGGEFSSGATGRLAIAALSSRFVAVRFTPATVGTQRADLRIDTCIGACTQTVELRGVATAAAAEVTCSALDFGRVAVGDCGSRPITCVNRGLTPESVTQVTVQERPSPFRAFIAGDRQIPPGESVPLQVSFCPERPGRAQNAVLVFLEPGSEPLRIPVEGLGT